MKSLALLDSSLPELLLDKVTGTSRIRRLAKRRTKGMKGKLCLQIIISVTLNNYGHIK
jgi:hypothetical protein